MQLLQLLSSCQISQLSGYGCINHHSRLQGLLAVAKLQLIYNELCEIHLSAEKMQTVHFYSFLIYAFYIFQYFQLHVLCLL